MTLLSWSVFFKAGMQNAAAFPVPLLALARISLPFRAIGMLFSWIGDGLSNPFSLVAHLSENSPQIHFL